MEFVAFIFVLNDNYERRRKNERHTGFVAAVEPARALRVTFQYFSTLMIINVTVPTNSTKTNVRESRVNDEF